MYHIYNQLHVSEQLLAQPILVLRYHPKTVCTLADALVYTRSGHCREIKSDESSPSTPSILLIISCVEFVHQLIDGTASNNNNLFCKQTYDTTAKDEYISREAREE